MSGKETLDAMRLDVVTDGFVIIVTTTGGGVSQHFPVGKDYKIISNRLRMLADRLDRNVEEREREQDRGTSIQQSIITSIRQSIIDREFNNAKNHSLGILKKDMKP